MLIKRIATALIAIPLLILLISRGGEQLFTVMIMLAAGSALFEFYGLTMRSSLNLKLAGLALGLCLVWSFYYFYPYVAPEGNRYVAGLFYLFVSIPTLATFSILLLQFMMYPRRLAIHGTSAPLFIGVLYICMFLSYLILLHQGSAGKQWIFFLLLVLWCGDTGAYVTGRLFGRHPLSPLVSPKKTVEGAIGGVLLSVCAAVAGYRMLMSDLTLGQAVLLTVAVSLAGILGDLCESTVKRHAGNKDSGTLLPGHGGMLDRIDSLLFAAPVAYYFKILIA